MSTHTLGISVDGAAYDALIARFGGQALEDAYTRAKEARAPENGGGVGHELDPAAHLDAEDARSDAAALREEAVWRAALEVGVGIGAVVAQRPALSPDEAIRLGGAVAMAVLGADGLMVPDAADVARDALDAVASVHAALDRSGSTVI